MQLDWDAPPLSLLDSKIEDVHYFGGDERVTLGVGRASFFESDSPTSLKGKNASRALGLENESPSVASRLLVMGGWPFPTPPPRSGRKKKKDSWSDLPRSRWVVPALALVSEKGKTLLTLTVLASPKSRSEQQAISYYHRLVRDLLAARRLERDNLEKHLPVPGLRRDSNIPPELIWLTAAEDAIASVSRKRLKKVVLSRSVQLVFDGELRPSTVLRNLIASSPEATAFAIKRRGSVFLGASPEKLMSIRDGVVEIECLAASAPRGRDEKADHSLGAKLLCDAKSREEHSLVVQAAVRSVSRFSSRIEVARAPTLKKLSTIQHLYTPLKAELLPGQDIWSVALSLWPSPAIAGEPRESALRWIHRSEPFSRGWYAGVIGCISSDYKNGRLIIGIRSGILRGKRKEAVIFAGAGLVAGSDPKKEFEETGWKMETMKRALSLPSLARHSDRR